MEKKEILFGLGEPNDAYAQYFDGQSYLNRLTETGGPMANVTLDVAIIGIFIIRVDRFYFVPWEEVIIKNGESQLRN